MNLTSIFPDQKNKYKANEFYINKSNNFKFYSMVPHSGFSRKMHLSILYAVIIIMVLYSMTNQDTFADHCSDHILLIGGNEINIILCFVKIEYIIGRKKYIIYYKETDQVYD